MLGLGGEGGALRLMRKLDFSGAGRLSVNDVIDAVRRMGGVCDCVCVCVHVCVCLSMCVFDNVCVLFVFIFVCARASSTAVVTIDCLYCHCSVLQCVAVRCSVLQCVAVCCSVLQCVAMRCSVLQW